MPSWVSYAAQAGLIGVLAHHVPVAPGEGGICDPGQLARTVAAARSAGRRIGSVILTLPDNPTGRLARPGTVRALCDVAAENDLTIICDEIYRDLVHDQAADVLSPAAVAPRRTVVTTALSKSLALGGWRIGAARLPDGPHGDGLQDRLLGVVSEIWSVPSAPVQQAAAYAFGEPAEITERVTRSRRLHVAIARAVADLAGHLLERYGAGVLPASAFGEDPSALRVRMATGLLYGDSDAQREAALTASNPLTLPWISAALTRIEEILADLAPPSQQPGNPISTRQI